ncbi:MAG: PIN domain-containing protein [Thermoprotei archaeon]
MNKKNFRDNNNKILLDTSFLLPILGFETSNRIMRAFQKLGSYELYYSDISILEALWKIVKVIKGTREELSRISEGISAIRETMKYAPIDEKVVENAIYMFKLGHKDMIDNLLYSIAMTKKLRLLTVDKDLVEFIKKHDLDKDSVILPEELE